MPAPSKIEYGVEAIREMVEENYTAEDRKADDFKAFVDSIMEFFDEGDMENCILHAMHNEVARMTQAAGIK
jgi:hypothetical protein